MFLRVLIVSAYAFLLPSILLADSAVITAAPGKNVYLRVNERMVSPSGNVVLVMQSDGNLVTYNSNCIGNPRCAVWHSNTYREQGEYFLAMQEDGNLVIYRGTPEEPNGAIWQSGSYGNYGNYFLSLQNDKNLVVYRGRGPRDNRGPVWSSSSGLIKNENTRSSSPSVTISECVYLVSTWCAHGSCSQNREGQYCGATKKQAFDACEEAVEAHRKAGDKTIYGCG